MRPIIYEMVEFIESRTIGPCVARLIQAAPMDDSMDDWATLLAEDPNKDENLARITVRQMFLPFLHWLSESGESEKKEPLSLLRWPNSWRKFIKESREISELFEIVGDSLNFQPSISGSERMEIQSYVKENFRPQDIA